MTTETTQPPELTGTLRDQLSAVQALRDLIDRQPQLPAPYISVHPAALDDHTPARIALQLDCPTHFEEWRTALAVPPAAVHLFSTSSNVWLSTDTTFAGIAVHVTGFNVPVSYVQAQAPRDRSAVTA